jgi:hypothetical protein
VGKKVKIEKLLAESRKREEAAGFSVAKHLRPFRTPE